MTGQEVSDFHTQLSRERGHERQNEPDCGCGLNPQRKAVVGLTIAQPCWAWSHLPRGCLHLHIRRVTEFKLRADSMGWEMLWGLEAEKLKKSHFTTNIAESSWWSTAKVLLTPKIFVDYCCALLLSCPFLSLCSFPPAFDLINQGLVPNLVKFQLPCYSFSALWEMKVWKCV